MTTWHLLTTTWTLEPTVLAGCLAAAIGYALALPAWTTRAWFFLGGLLILALALLSPLDTLGDRYLFSAHMLQHLLLILAVPPLLLRGIPPETADRVLRWAPAHATERILGQPVVAWILEVATLWIWHLPSLYDAALTNQSVHIGQHLMFLTTSIIFWWPVVMSAPAHRRLGIGFGVLYLFAAAAANSVLGIILTFAPSGLYAPYLHPIDRLGILGLLRDGWGLTPSADQQLGGLLMWIPGGMVYLLAMLILFARWHAEADAESEPGAAWIAAAPVLRRPHDA